MGGRPGLARATSRLFKMFQTRTGKRAVALAIMLAAGHGALAGLSAIPYPEAGSGLLKVYRLQS